MTRFVIFLVVVTSQLMLGLPQAPAMDTGPYFPLDEGRAWIFDRDILLMSGSVHAFSNASGREMCMASEHAGGSMYWENGSQGVRLVGQYNRDTASFDDASANPVVIATPDMNLGQTVHSTFQGSVSVDSTLAAVEDVNVPAGTFNDALRFALQVDAAGCAFAENIWVARRVGFVKLERVVETPSNCDGCFLSCGSFNEDFSQVENRLLQLDKALRPSNTVIVIPQ